MLLTDLVRRIFATVSLRLERVEVIEPLLRDRANRQLRPVDQADAVSLNAAATPDRPGDESERLMITERRSQRLRTAIIKVA
jgi:hypothetical protein